MHRGLTISKVGVSERLLPTALRILLVEDNDMIAILLSDLLEGLGHVICSIARTESEAISAAIRHEPDILIVDVKLKQGTGVSAVREITRIRPFPHFFITGEGIHAVKSEAIVLQKPFREADLMRAIEQVLE
jgi:CheY-like chemotaxis protein